MQTSLPSPTKAQRDRFARMYDMGCICCHIEGNGYEPPHIHHMLSGGRRIGQDATIPLCPWHHTGLTKVGHDAEAMTAIFGPSLALSKRAFVAKYGTEDRLLELTNERLIRLKYVTGAA